MATLAELNQNEIQTFSQPEPDPLAQPGGVDAWGIIKRRKWLVILGAILGLGLGYIYLLQASPVYESLAQFLIEDKQPPAIPITGFETQFVTASAEAKHAIVIKSPRIIGQAYTDFNLEKLPTFQGNDQAVSVLIKDVQVEVVEEGTNVLTISYRGPNPDDTQKVVNSILQTYQKFLQETYEDTGQKTRDLIDTARLDLMTKWDKLEDDYKQFKARVPLMYDRDGAINIHSVRQADYELERIRLIKQLTELTSRVKGVQAALDNGESLESVILLAEQENNRQSRAHQLALQRDRYITLVMRYEELTTRYGPDHPEVISIRKGLEKYAEAFPEIADNSSSASRDKMVAFVKGYLGSLKQQQSQLTNQVDSYNNLFLQEEAAAKELQSLQDKDNMFRSEIERTQQLFEVVVKSLEEISLTEGYEGYTYQTLAEPAVGEKVAPMAVKVIPASLILGLLAGFGLGYLVDVADKAFRTPDEVSQIMRLPVVGHIPLIDIAKQKVLPNSEVVPVVCTVHRPKSPQSESYRAVRTALYFNNRGAKHQVIQVTSPMPGDGKSTLASNLAVTIAQSGKSVLLLDADFRRPTLHKVFGIGSAEVGLASVVNGEADPADAFKQIQEIPNLRIMACGPRPHNPSELLSSQQFADVLELLREQFDFVIVDTPPVLAVSDPLAVAARVDGVIMTFRIHKRARPLAVRARDALANIGANLIGVVVNGVDQEAGGYYSQYRYGYTGYRYAYNYRYGYGTYGSEASENKAIKKYFDDDSKVSATAMTTRENG